jgi:hypothetical protein
MLILPNDTIENGANWKISANSPPKEVKLNIQKTEYFTGQELKFSLDSPVRQGNYTFILIDPQGFEEYRVTSIIPPDNDVFTYPIPNNNVEGTYIAYLFWHNQTDAGVQTQDFSISFLSNPVDPLDFSLVLIIGAVALGGTVIGISSYITTKKVKSKHREKLKLVLEKCSDLMNLHYVIVLDKHSGVDIYSNTFNNAKELDTTLISGFLHAIHNFGDEVIEVANGTKTVKIDYKDSIIIMTEFVNLRLIVILKHKPSENFIYDIESLAYDIYKYFGKQIDKFTGILKPFHPIHKLVEHHMHVSFLYPLSIDLSLKTKSKLSQDEKHMVERASKFLKENDAKYFYSLYLLPENACTPSDFETINRLIKKEVFRPYMKLEE